ncbi:MAG: DUF502 domain-containing protein [Burkholderiaceae bacterium]|jgi:uncharacterized membrane protein|nr:DUF502 domain-containing protein [Burkholderiaceae bacterium]
MPLSSNRLLNTFLTGLLAALPLAATVLVFVWAVRVLVDYLGPGSYVGRVLKALGLGFANSEAASYLLGAGIVIAAIFVLGALVQTRLRRVLAAALDAVVMRIPVVRSVYDMASRLVGLLGQREPHGMRSMSPVWLHFGGVGGVAVLGLLSTNEPVRVGELDYLAVLVPTAPVPVGGGLLYVPRDWVTPADVGIDGLTSIYVSMGMTSKQHIGPAR